MNHSLPRMMVLILILAIAVPALAAGPELPVAGLENRVEFWKKIYTQYGKDDIVIHDRFYVNLIYDVADESNVDSKLSAINHALKDILSNIDTADSLGTVALQLRDAIKASGVQVNRKSISDLIEGVHTQRGIKERFRDGIIRSGKYADSFRKIMNEHGVIPELALLPLVESSFQNVRSKAAALGMWQFTRGTGKSYLTINKKVDQRLDPQKATIAAAKLLRDNYRALGNWPLAITAYNHGRAGMQRAKREQGEDLPKIITDYRGPVFGYASMNFYTEFLAAIEVYQNYQQYFGQLTLDKPTGTGTTTATAKAKAVQVAATSKYKVKSGDTLHDIAVRFGTSIRQLMESNNLTKPAIYAGQLLLIK